MFTAIRERLESEEGFTLIELLVVVIIIGILAAIAIPTFLRQRERGWQAELTSAVRNAALEVEAVATSNSGTYPAAGTAAGQGGAIVAPFGVRPEAGTADDMTLTYAQVTTPSAGFTVCGTHPQLPAGSAVRYNSVTGGLQPFAASGGC